MKFYVFTAQMLQWLALPLLHSLFKLNGTFVIHGKENMEALKDQNVIFASNHQNELDPVAQRVMLPIVSKHTPLFWVTRKQDEYHWKGWRKLVYSDWFFKAGGGWPAYRGHKDYGKSLRHHLNILKDGNSVGIFPQGTMGVKDKLTVEELRNVPAHGGVAYLAAKTGTPIVPTTIHGTRGMNAFKVFFKKTRVDVYFHPPIYVSKDEENYKEVAAKVMDVVYSV
ncbi:MAG: lysophospholipid acyltransferase family protein [Patescibacteria group bacterium UBA2103]